MSVVLKACGKTERHTLCDHIVFARRYVVTKSGCITKISCIDYWESIILSISAEFKQIVIGGMAGKLTKR